MGSIEEDIKILENLIVTLPNFHLGGSESIRNILQNYKRQKQINEEHQKINGELRERVKELEEENAMLRKSNNIAENVNIDDVTKVINKSYEEFMSNYIPKQAVIDKIKELDIAILECEYDDDDVEEYKNDVEKEKRILLIKKSALEELLEEK